LTTPTANGPGPLVSAIIVFLNEADFLEEAIQSVIDQSYPHWELILVDDGSTDASSDIARRLASERPDRVRYVDHEDHENRGMSASRNAGVEAARGDYIAYLDGDDRWLPGKLSEHLDLLARHPQARLVYGPLTLWHSWTGDSEDVGRDELYGLESHGPDGDYTMKADRVIGPPELVAAFVRHKDLIPAGATFQRSLFHEAGGAEEAFRTSYEDAVVLVKMCLRASVYCTSTSSYLYRQHRQTRDRHSHRALEPGEQRAQSHTARRRFLDWVEAYLTEQGRRDHEVWRSLRAAQRPYRRPRVHQALATSRHAGRLASGATKEAWRHAKLVARGQLTRVPIEQITDEFAFALSGHGWNRYSAVLESHDAEPGASLESTDFHRFFNDEQVNAVRDLNDLLSLSDNPGRYNEIAQFWLGEYPWGGLIGPEPARTGAPYGWAYDEAENTDTSELWGKGRNLWYRPNDEYTVRTEWRRIIELYESMKHRYSPLKARGFPRVTLFVRRDGDRRAVIVDGHHRLAILAHLGAEQATVEVDAVVREADVADWPSVLTGYCSPEEALVIFHSFFELDGSERFSHVSAKWETPSLDVSPGSSSPSEQPKASGS
jgi:hypothetical protein